MNTATVSEDEGHQEHHDHGLSDFGYIKVAVLLGVLTALEVATYFFDFWSRGDSIVANTYGR